MVYAGLSYKLAAPSQSRTEAISFEYWGGEIKKLGVGIPGTHLAKKV